MLQEADLNKENKDGRTALYIAAGLDHVECLKKLINAGADLNKENKDGQTALYIAAGLDHVECLKKLISAGD